MLWNTKQYTITSRLSNMKHYEAFSHVSGRDYEYQWLKTKRYAHYKLSNSAPKDVLCSWSVSAGQVTYCLVLTLPTWLAMDLGMPAFCLNQPQTLRSSEKPSYLILLWVLPPLVSVWSSAAALLETFFAEFHKSSLPAWRPPCLTPISLSLRDDHLAWHPSRSACVTTTLHDTHLAQPAWRPPCLTPITLSLHDDHLEWHPSRSACVTTTLHDTHLAQPAWRPPCMTPISLSLHDDHLSWHPSRSACTTTMTPISLSLHDDHDTHLAQPARRPWHPSRSACTTTTLHDTHHAQPAWRPPWMTPISLSLHDDHDTHLAQPARRPPCMTPISLSLRDDHLAWHPSRSACVTTTLHDTHLAQPAWRPPCMTPISLSLHDDHLAWHPSRSACVTTTLHDTHLAQPAWRPPCMTPRVSGNRFCRVPPFVTYCVTTILHDTHLALCDDQKLPDLEPLRQRPCTVRHPPPPPPPPTRPADCRRSAVCPAMQPSSGRLAPCFKCYPLQKSSPQFRTWS